MRRIVTYPLALVALVFATSFSGAQQASSVVQYLDRLAAAPGSDRSAANDEASRQAAATLIAEPRSEVESSLPAILRYADDTSQNASVRKNATFFLMMITMRHDGPDLLSTHSADIAQLLTDSDRVIQRTAAGLLYSLIVRNGAQQSAAYVPALTTALQNPGTPQDTAVAMLVPLLKFGSGQPTSIATVHNFLTRSDLNLQTKIDSLRPLAMLPDLPEQISQDLCARFDDPDPQVRIAAIVAYSNAASLQDSAARYLRGDVSIPSEDPGESAQRKKAAASTLQSDFNFVREGRKRVERIAADETENPKIRQLAKDALAGGTGLNPNILEPNPVDPYVKPTNHQ